MNTELVSIIVPVFNAETYLPGCLRSIVRQTYSPLEVILVDDGSTDKSGEICDSFAAIDTRVKVIHQRNTGLWAARNAGQDAASGDYLFFPDADDCFHPETIRLLYEAINWLGKQYPLAICCDKKIWTEDEIPVNLSIHHDFTVYTSERLIELLCCSNDYTGFCVANQWNKLYRKTSLQGLRSRDYPRAQDRDFQMRLFVEIEEAIVVEAPLYYWRQHDGSLSSSAVTPYLRYKCRTEMTHKNYLGLSPGQAKYKRYLISFLFKSMVFYKNVTWRTRWQKDAFEECGRFKRELLRDYLRLGYDKLFTKLIVLALLDIMPLNRFVMRLTNNF